MKNCPSCQHTYPDDVDFCPHDGTHLVSEATHNEAELAAQLSGQFRIVRCLGSGGMGSVFLAEQIAVGNRPVALKVLARKLLDDPEFLERFHNEAGSTGRICHPNVVTIYESGQADDGTPFIAMEYLQGRSLREWIKARGPIPALECAEILWQIARGLNAAHKLGIIHRDLKPDNIFLTRDTEGELVLKLVDFGIAKLRESSSHTLTGTLMGTPAYMSYEQASGMRSEELDARSDIYSLGIVVYEMLAGCLPFESDTPIGFISKHLTEKPSSFRAMKPDLPGLPELESVVMKALAKNRDERYGCALDFAREFAEGARAVVPGENAEARETVATQPQMVAPAGPQLTADIPTQIRRQESAADVATRIEPGGQTGQPGGHTDPPLPAAVETVKLLSRAAAAAATTGPLVAQERPADRTVPLPPVPAPASDPEATAQRAASRHPVPGPAARPHDAQAHGNYAGKLPRAHAVVPYKERRHWGQVVVLFIVLVGLIAGAIWLLAPKIRKLSRSSKWQAEGRPALAAMYTGGRKEK
jgi:serine/threonine protein kinase